MKKYIKKREQYDKKVEDMYHNITRLENVMLEGTKEMSDKDWYILSTLEKMASIVCDLIDQVEPDESEG